MNSQDITETPKNTVSLKEIALLFLKLGSISFGGPAAHIAMMEQEVVRKRKWMTHEHFLDLIGATNLIPGPNSTEMAMHCGYEKAGKRGLLVSGACFIFPAVLVTSLFAWTYLAYGQLPNVQPFIYGTKPAIISIMISSMFFLGKKVIKTLELGAVLIATTIACIFFGLNDIIALFGAGFYGVVSYLLLKRSGSKTAIVPIFLMQNESSSLFISYASIFWSFFKIGAILYGSGYVLYAFLDEEFVSNGILSKQQLIDAVTVGQITPGPVFSSATFVGWQLGGFWGATVATVAIFLPSFVFVLLLNPLFPKLRQSKVMSAFLDAINAASVAVIIAIIVELGKDTITDWKTIAIALISLTAGLVFKKLNSAIIVLGGALLGYLLTLVS